MITYDNIKSHKKQGFHPMFRRYGFEKNNKLRGVKGLNALSFHNFSVSNSSLKLFT